MSDICSTHNAIKICNAVLTGTSDSFEQKKQIFQNGKIIASLVDLPKDAATSCQIPHYFCSLGIECETMALKSSNNLGSSCENVESFHNNLCSGKLIKD